MAVPEKGGRILLLFHFRSAGILNQTKKRFRQVAEDVSMVPTPKRKTEMDTDSLSDPADQVYIHLSDRDRDLVLANLDTEVEPNDALKSLAERYRQRYG